MNRLPAGLILCFLACSLLVSGCALTAETDTGDAMEPATGQTFVLVHGAWGHAEDWRPVAEELEALGHRVIRAELTGVGGLAHLATPETDLSVHVEDVVRLLETEDLRGVVLMGHSYGGFVVTGVAARVPQRVERLIYVDAVLPLPGESLAGLRPDDYRTWKRLAKAEGDGWMVPPFWPDPGDDTPHPMASLVEPIEFDPEAVADVPIHYILTKEPGRTWDRFGLFADRARAREARVSELPTGHNPQRTMVPELVALLAER